MATRWVSCSSGVGDTESLTLSTELVSVLVKLGRTDATVAPAASLPPVLPFRVQERSRDSFPLCAMAVPNTTLRGESVGTFVINSTRETVLLVRLLYTLIPSGSSVKLATIIYNYSSIIKAILVLVSYRKVGV